MSNSRHVVIFHGVGAVVLAVGLLYLGAFAGDTFGLPVINSWALMHGAIFVVFPLYFAMSYLMLRPVVRQFQGGDTRTLSSSGRISILAIFSMVLAGTGFLIPIVGPAFGILAGNIARRRCKKDPELIGSGFALSGLILGYLGLAYGFYVIST